MRIRPTRRNCPTGVFGIPRAVASRDLRPFWKWRAVIQRYSQEMEQNRRRECSSSLFNDCPFDEWRRFLKDTAERGRWSQLVAVNAFMNARRYVADERNWGVSDYWATPGEFMSRAGDCEDFAIAKYLSLRELGWDAGDLRVVVVRDFGTGRRARRARGLFRRAVVGSRQSGEPRDRNRRHRLLPARVLHQRDIMVAASACQRAGCRTSAGPPDPRPKGGRDACGRRSPSVTGRERNGGPGWLKPRSRRCKVAVSGEFPPRRPRR